jgi:hypothetical protein
MPFGGKRGENVKRKGKDNMKILSKSVKYVQNGGNKGKNVYEGSREYGIYWRITSAGWWR